MKRGRLTNEFLTKLNFDTEIEAGEKFSKGEKFSWFNLFWRPTRIFLQRYLRHLGFLDGFYGLTLTFLAMFSQMAMEIKLWEKTHPKSS